MGPTRSIQEALQEREILITFFGSVLAKDVDYYESEDLFKPVLLRPGAEELAKHFGLLTFELERVASSPDTYHYRCWLLKGSAKVGSGEGISCADLITSPDSAARDARDLALGLGSSSLPERSFVPGAGSFRKSWKYLLPLPLGKVRRCVWSECLRHRLKRSCLKKKCRCHQHRSLLRRSLPHRHRKVEDLHRLALLPPSGRAGISSCQKPPL